MSESVLDGLRKAGINKLPAAQQKVFEELSPEELAVASKIQKRLSEAAPEVEGQVEGDNNNCLC